MLLQAVPYFVFDGRALEAIHFYVDVLEAEVLDITYFRDMPEDPKMPLDEETKKLVLNATIRLPNGTFFMFSDTMPGMPHVIGTQITTTLTYDNEEDVQRVFAKLSEEGTVEMDLQETFWSPLYGRLTDRFGNAWQIDVDPDGQAFEQFNEPR